MMTVLGSMVAGSTHCRPIPWLVSVTEAEERGGQRKQRHSSGNWVIGKSIKNTTISHQNRQRRVGTIVCWKKTREFQGWQDEATESGTTSTRERGGGDKDHWWQQGSGNKSNDDKVAAIREDAEAVASLRGADASRGSSTCGVRGRACSYNNEWEVEDLWGVTNKEKEEEAAWMCEGNKFHGGSGKRLTPFDGGGNRWWQCGGEEDCLHTLHMIVLLPLNCGCN